MLALPSNNAVFLVIFYDKPEYPHEGSRTEEGTRRTVTVPQGRAPEDVRFSFVLPCKPELGRMTTLSYKADWGILSWSYEAVSPGAQLRIPSLCGGETCNPRNES